MRCSDLWGLAIAAPCIISAIELAPRSANPRVIGLDIERRKVADVLAHDNARLARIRKRQRTVEQTLDNEDTLYYANLTLGTPAQQLRLHIDTGSSDLWVNTANSSFCSSSADPCIGGTYDPNASSSHRYVNSDFDISYLDGTGATGDYVTDTLGFGGVTLQNFQFGVGESSSSEQGVLGIGYTTNEVQVQVSGDQPYPNLPVALLDGGHINRNAYSLWLNDLDASTGTILFGGVNRAKYQGNLETVPIYREAGQYAQFIIAMTAIGINGSSITSRNLPAAVLLDSGSTLSRLPVDIVAAIYSEVGIEYQRDAGVGLAYCSLANTRAYLEFSFSGINIQVPFDELFIEAGTDTTGQRVCIFGIAPNQGLGPISILGDTFLRSAYVVYDLELNQISLAQTIFNATGNDVVEIASGTAAIPGATPAPSTVTSLAAGTATNGAQIGPSTGSLTALTANPTGSSATSSALGVQAYPTKAAYLAGAALVAGANFLL